MTSSIIKPDLGVNNSSRVTNYMLHRLAFTSSTYS